MQRIRFVLLHGSHASLIPVCTGKAVFVHSFTSGFKTGFIEKSALFEHGANDYEKFSGKGDNSLFDALLLLDSPISGR